MISVQDLINEAVERNNQVRSGARDASYFHASDAGTCYRKRVYKRLGIEPTSEIAVGALRKMVAGDAGHEKLQSLLNRYGKLFAAEGEVQTEHIKGHFDGIIKHDNQKCLLEIKTIEKWGMTHIRKDGPKKEHELQMWTYWLFLRKDYKDLDQAVLSYVKREDFEAQDFVYEWNQEIHALAVLEEWTPLIAYWEAQELPPCTCKDDYNGSGPKYCRYATSEEECCDESLFDPALFPTKEVPV